MKLSDACKLFQDELCEPLKAQNPTLKELEELQKIAQESFKQHNNKKYQDALAVIEINLALQNQQSSIQGKQLYADIDDKGDSTVSLRGLNDKMGTKLFEAIRKSSGFIEIKPLIYPNGPEGLTEDDLALAVVNYASATESTCVILTTSNNKSTLGEKIKALCKERGIDFFRQTPEEKKAMEKLSGDALKADIAQKLDRETKIDNSKMLESEPHLQITAPKPLKTRLERD